MICSDQAFYQVMSISQAGSDGGPPPSQLDRLEQAEAEDEAEVPLQQLRLRLSHLPEDHGTTQGPEPHPCRGETQ